MELKKNNFMSLLMYSLKGKKSWFILSTVIIFITTLLVPFILGIGGEFFIAFGIVEVFILAFVNCLVDNSLLHNDSKLAYYKSKPVSLRDQILINVINNHIFTGFMLVLILVSEGIQNYNIEIFEIFKMIIPWLSVGIFLSSLSSILAGNTLVAGIMTLFNFALPAIFYLIVQFMFSILEDIVIGFSANVLMEYFVDAFYKLDYIYLVVYQNKPLDIVYFLIFGAFVSFISFLIFKMIKRRKNENTGNFMAFDGFKYFVSVLASLIIPAFFAVTSYDRSVVSEMIVSFLLAALSYYIIIAIMEKAFRISRLSIKVFLVSMTTFIVITGATVLFANQYKNVVPNPEDVKVAYIGNSRWRYIETFLENEEGEIDEESLLEFHKKYYNNNIVLFADKENIENITKMHKELLNNQGYDKDTFYMNNVVINYYLNDGSILTRDYKINNDDNKANNHIKDEIASNILNSRELKEKKFFYLYDEDYYQKNKDNISFVLGNDKSEATPRQNLAVDEVRQHLINDLDTMYKYTNDKAFMALSSYNFEIPVREYKELGYYIQITIINKDDNSKDLYQTIYLDERFENTREYLNIK